MYVGVKVEGAATKSDVGCLTTTNTHHRSYCETPYQIYIHNLGRGTCAKGTHRLFRLLENELNLLQCRISVGLIIIIVTAAEIIWLCSSS
jgi:hypothetical protein